MGAIDVFREDFKNKECLAETDNGREQLAATFASGIEDMVSELLDMPEEEWKTKYQARKTGVGFTNFLLATGTPDATGAYVAARLHLFPEVGHADVVPHDHAWDFASHLLGGQLEHQLYDERVGDELLKYRSETEDGKYRFTPNGMGILVPTEKLTATQSSPLITMRNEVIHTVKSAPLTTTALIHSKRKKIYSNIFVREEPNQGQVNATLGINVEEVRDRLSDLIK